MVSKGEGLSREAAGGGDIDIRPNSNIMPQMIAVIQQPRSWFTGLRIGANRACELAVECNIFAELAVDCKATTASYAVECKKCRASR